jgi:hypothetical protein
MNFFILHMYHIIVQNQIVLTIRFIIPNILVNAHVSTFVRQSDQAHYFHSVYHPHRADPAHHYHAFVSFLSCSSPSPFILLSSPFSSFFYCSSFSACSLFLPCKQFVSANRSQCPHRSHHAVHSQSLWRVARGSKLMFLELIHGLFIT